MSSTPCFWVEKTGRKRKQAMRWSEKPCPSGDECRVRRSVPLSCSLARADRLLGHTCDHCGEEFTGRGTLSSHTMSEWIRPTTGETAWSVTDFGPGAMYDAGYLNVKGPDGLSLAVVLPNLYIWAIDMQASNCTMKDDWEQLHHHCWIRHGTPPLVTVDKNGPTCAAGAGSIQAGDYHGFLRDGHLIDA